MQRKIFWLGILVIMLVFGMTVFSCNATIFDGNNDENNSGSTGGNNEAIYYNVSFNTMGAIGTPPEALIVTTGSTIIIHDDSGFSRTGYILDGWYTIIYGTTSYYDAGSQYTVTNNVTFYAN